MTHLRRKVGTRFAGSLKASVVSAHSPFHAAVIGAGPAGLMAAEVLAQGGARVTVCDRMPSPGRKFLLAGRRGLTCTPTE